MSTTDVSTVGATVPAARLGSDAKAPSKWGDIGRVLMTFRVEFAWVFIFSLFTNVLMLTPTVYMLQVFDRVLHSGNLLTLAAISLIAVVLYGVMAFSEWLRSRLLVRLGGRFDEALGRRVFGAMFREQLASLRRHSMQGITDLNFIRTFFTGNGVLAVADTPWVTVYVFVLFVMHPWLGWTALAFCVLQFALALMVHRLTSKRIKAAQEVGIEASQVLQAKLRNAEAVEAMGMQRNLALQWKAVNDRHQDRLFHAQARQRNLQALMKWVQYSQQALILAVGALLAIDGKISAGAMIASNALLAQALRPIGVIVGVWSQFVEARQALGRLNDLLQRHPPEQSTPPAQAVAGQITLKNLVAKAPQRKEPILKGLDAEFLPGEVIGIVGPSGAGKSTLARCLLGIWPDVEGNVLIDGHDVRAWPREDLGPHVGYLPQDVELFDGSIAENIGRFLKASPNTIIEAATRAGIHDMILRLPQGYDTPIGEAGSVLSGGQRQRLGLARAIIGKPTVVVLDEPNANLDEAGEAALLRTVRELKQRGTTVFMVVHQTHLLSVADRVLMLEAGRISKLAKVVVAPPAVPASPSTPPPALSQS